MIISFGGVARKKQPDQDIKQKTNEGQPGTSGINGMSEELRDEHYNKKLMEAFQLKNQMRNYEALEIYLDIIGQEFLKDSKIDKHVYMRFNAFKNIGEIYERAIKIKEKDPFIWTRLGFLEYETFKNFNLAKSCFEIAIQSYTTIQRRSSHINPILVKLAEIAFQEFDYKTSEQMIDSILVRQNERGDQKSEFFAFLMKSYFCSWKGDDRMNQVYLFNARKIQPNAKYSDLEIIKKFNESVQEKLQSKDLVIKSKIYNQEFDRVEHSYEVLRAQNQQHIIQLKPQKEYSTLFEYFDDFLLQLAASCEQVSWDTLQNSLIDSSKYSVIFDQYFQDSQATFEDQLKKYNDIMNQKEKKNCAQEQQTNSTIAQQPNQTKKQAATQQQNAQETKRQLRKKLDSTEQQLKQYNLQALKDLKDYLITENPQLSDQDLEFIYSINEIQAARQFLVQEKEQKPQNNANDNENSQNLNKYRNSGQDFQLSKKSDQIFNAFGKFNIILKKIQGRGVLYVLRNMLRYLIDDDNNKNLLLNFENSCYLYRLFLVVVNNDFSIQQLDAFGSFSVILTLFEMSLFNDQVMKHVKSNGLISQRKGFYDYLKDKEIEVFIIMNKDIQYWQESSQNLDKIHQFESIKIRFFNCMMFNSFEILNDMHSSIRYFQRLDIEQLRQFGSVCLPWISSNYSIDEYKIAQYGSCKIKEAQVFKNNDVKLMELKSKQLEERQGKISGEQIQPQFSELTYFYLDQLCIYLQKAYQNEFSVSANFSTQEEKIKEMWDKLSYSLCYSESRTMFRVVNHLFSILTAFQSLQKQYYDQYMLKKLEFEKILCEISDKLKIVFIRIMESTKESNFDDISLLKNSLIHELRDITMTTEPRKQINELMRTEQNLLRLLSNEFTHYQVNQQQIKQGDKILQSIQMSLFYMEMFIAILKSNHGEDLNTQLKQVTKLIKQFDKVCKKNHEVFLKSYFYFLTQIFPPLMNFFVTHVNYLDSSKEIHLGNINGSSGFINNNNDLLALLIQLSQYFFDLKFSMKELQKLSQANPSKNSRDIQMSSKKNRNSRENSENFQRNSSKQDDEDEEEEESEDEKKSYQLKMVYGMKANQNKIWQQIVNYNGTQKMNLTGSGIQNQQLGYLYQNDLIDAYFLKDILSFCNLLCNGRLSQCGTMIKKDVANIITFLDVICKFLLEKQKQIFESCSKAKHYYSIFQEASDKTPFKFFLMYNISQQNQQVKCTCGTINQRCNLDNLKYKQTIENLSSQLLNIMSHICFEASPYQIVNQKGKKKLTLVESFPSLYGVVGPNNSNTISYLQALRDKLSPINLVYSDFKVQSQIIHTQILSEIYLSVNSHKLNQDYKTNENYIKNKVSYKKSLNIMMISLLELYNQIKQELKNGRTFITQNSSNYSMSWANTNQAHLIKICLTQMITLYLINRQQASIKNLQQAIIILSIICEKIEKLLILQQDPRYRCNNAYEVEQAICQLLERLIEYIQRSQNNLGDEVQFKLIPDLFEVYILQMHSITSQFQNRFDNMEINLSFDYPCLQSIIQRKMCDKVDLSNDPVQKYKFLCQIAKSIKIARMNQSLNGCVELFIILIKYGIKLGLQLKYEENCFSDQELAEMKMIFETVIQTLSTNRDIFKFIQNTLVPQSTTYQVGSDREESIVLDPNISASLLRAQIFETNEIPAYNQYENSLFKLYLYGDRLFQLLSLASPKVWMKMLLQYSLAKALKMEIELNQCERNRTCFEIMEKIRDMLLPLINSMNNYEDNYQNQSIQNFYQNDEKKNLITQINHFDFSICDLRIKIRRFYLEICQQCQKYEYIKEVQKRFIQLYRQSENQKQKDSGSTSQALQVIKQIELRMMMELSRDKFIESLNQRVKMQLSIFLNIRNNIISNNGSLSVQEMDQLRSTYKDFKDKLLTTKDQIPNQLRDAIDIFIETHSKKGYLSKLINDEQKRLLRQTLLMCSAFCGPDSEVAGEKITSKFLDFSRIFDEEYELDGLMISIKWFLNILEERTNIGNKEGSNDIKRAPAGSKIDLELCKKLKATLEELEKQIQDQNQRTIQAQQAYQQQIPSLFAEEQLIPQFPSIGTKVFNQQ
ncbi:UNKNOWN [Stylonychia lemnae]|uniref:Uncharacterized protein n=1 Tax=Stylonychia lemnae TaxID=5949 RepID=A0A077ZZH1_STYLE|nr:UNKNOWN [Stylonychia lemnae]|eukprot:CDW73908.1 UNKNOWN [Stylonychia lemnae]